MLVSIWLLMNVWKFGQTFGQAFLSLPSDTGEEHLLMSGCPTYFADTIILSKSEPNKIREKWKKCNDDDLIGLSSEKLEKVFCEIWIMNSWTICKTCIRTLIIKHPSYNINTGMFSILCTYQLVYMLLWNDYLRLHQTPANKKTITAPHAISWNKKVINSSPPGATYMRQWIWNALVQIMACRLFGAKPLFKQMLGYCQVDPKEQTLVKF